MMKIDAKYLLDLCICNGNLYITDQKGGSCTYFAHILPLLYIFLDPKIVSDKSKKYFMKKE